MVRAIWSGRIGVGLVGFQAKLYKAVEEGGIEFHLIHPECGGRIKYLYHCPKCAKVVERSELKKGYEIADDEYVILDDADFQSLPLKTVKSIEIEGFTRDDIDPRMFNTAFYLVPDKKGGDVKAFSLLYKVMEELGVKAIGKLTYREKEHLVVITPFDGIFLLRTLFYSEEIRDYEEIKPKQVALSEKELKLGKTLIEQMICPFEPTAYKNEYKHALEQLIQAKIEGRELVKQDVAESSSDLVEALLKSIGMKGG